MGRAMLRRGESLVFGAPSGPQAALFLPTPLFHSAGTSLLVGKKPMESRRAIS